MKKEYIFAALVLVLGLTLVICSLISTEKQESHFEPPEEKNTNFSSNQNLKKVLIIHSYHKGWGWNIDTEKGIIDGLEEDGFYLNQHYIFEKFYMDTKVTFITPEQKKARADEAIALIEEYGPDIVFINDDDALKYVAVPYTQNNPDRGLPFVFSGINADPTIYNVIDSLEKPGHTITGALERFPYLQSFSLAKRIFPDKSRIALFADSSSSSDFLIGAFNERYLEKINDSPLEVVDVVQVSTFDEWKEKIKEYQKKVDFIGILSYHQLKDEEGKVVPASEVVVWTINNNKLPEIGFLQFHAEDGFWCVVGVSPYKTGKYVGKIGANILNGKNVSEIPIIDPKLLDLAFNLERSKMLGIKIPIDILGMASETYQEIKKLRY